MSDWEIDIERIKSIPNISLSDPDELSEVNIKLLRGKTVKLDKETLDAYNEAINPDVPFTYKLKKFLTAQNRAGRTFKSVKDFVTLFVPFGKRINDLTDVVTNIIEDTMPTESKPALSSKTILTNLILAVAGLLVIFGVLPADLALTPETGWVMTLASVLNMILRAVTKQPISLLRQ